MIPRTRSGTIVSLFQTNQIGLRVERTMNWEAVPGAVQYVSGADYLALGSPVKLSEKPAARTRAQDGAQPWTPNTTQGRARGDCKLWSAPLELTDTDLAAVRIFDAMPPRRGASAARASRRIE